MTAAVPMPPAEDSQMPVGKASLIQRNAAIETAVSIYAPIRHLRGKIKRSPQMAQSFGKPEDSR